MRIILASTTILIGIALLYYKFGWLSVSEFNKDVDWLFWACVRLLEVWGEQTGLGYNLINIIIFIFLQPLLILLFFIMWRIEVNRRKKLTKILNGKNNFQ